MSEQVKATEMRWGAVASVESKIRQAWSMRRRCRRVPALRSSFAGFRFPPEVIVIAVRWYLRYSLSYRDVEGLLAERGINVDRVSVYRWGQRFTPLRSKPPPRPLRTGHRRPSAAPDPARLHRTRRPYLSPRPQRPTLLITRQRNSAASEEMHTHAAHEDRTSGPASSFSSPTGNPDRKSGEPGEVSGQSGPGS
jgi:hypothetical protein